MKNVTVSFFLFISFLVFATKRVEARSDELVHSHDDNDVNVPRESQATLVPVLAAIEKVCRLAKDDKLCLQSLEKDPDLVHADAKSLAFESIKVALSNATDISKHVKLLVTNTKFNPEIQQGMSDCQQEFIDVDDQLDDCLEALMAGDTKNVEEWLKAAMAAADTCMDSLKGFENILLQKTQTFHLLCENALAITKAFSSDPSSLLA